MAARWGGEAVAPVPLSEILIAKARDVDVSRAAGVSGCGPCHGLRAEVTVNGASVALAARRPRAEGESLDGPQLLNLDLPSSYIRVTPTRRSVTTAVRSGPLPASAFPHRALTLLFIHRRKI